LAIPSFSRRKLDKGLINFEILDLINKEEEKKLLSQEKKKYISKSDVLEHKESNENIKSSKSSSSEEGVVRLPSYVISYELSLLKILDNRKLTSINSYEYDSKNQIFYMYVKPCKNQSIKLDVSDFLYIDNKLNWSAKRKIKSNNKNGELVEKNVYPCYSYGITIIKRINYNLTEFSFISCNF
jgi:hypothetical protein